MRKTRNVYAVLVRRPNGKGPLGRPRNILQDGFKIVLKIQGPVGGCCGLCNIRFGFIDSGKFVDIFGHFVFPYSPPDRKRRT
jgi:hypothetical protein